MKSLISVLTAETPRSVFIPLQIPKPVCEELRALVLSIGSEWLVGKRNKHLPRFLVYGGGPEDIHAATCFATGWCNAKILLLEDTAENYAAKICGK